MRNHDSQHRPEPVEHRADWRYELPDSPEEVWEAIATADGLSA